MSYLEKFAQEKEKEKTKPMSFRLPESLHDAFTERCNDLNIKVADALRLLVEREMSSEVNSSESHLDENPSEEVNEELQNINEELQPVNKKVQSENKTIEKKSARPSRINGVRFNYNRWKVGKDVPCPVCREWKRSNKIAVHLKTHKMTKEEVFANEDYVRIADEMTEQRKKEQPDESQNT